MRFASLGSGSKGNATLVESGSTRVLVDCGFNLRETQARLAALGREAEQIDAILVTHEHGDHIGGVARFGRRFGTAVWASAGTSQRDNLHELPGFTRIKLQQTFTIGDITAKPVTVPHDAREPCQFVLEGGGKRLGVLSDLGSITPYVTESYAGCDALVLECNHDRRMLLDGPYPASLKRRVGGDWGHLSNDQAAQLLGEIAGPQLQHTVIAHVSDTNNRPELALEAIAPVLDGQGSLAVACQEQGFDWIEIN